MHAVVNCEEFIGKTVGRRVPVDSMKINPSDIESNRLWREHGFRPRIRKGVYRFHSHEEADQWLLDHLTRKQGN